MKLRAMKTLVLAFCVLAIATGGVGCKKDKSGNDGKADRSTRVKPRGPKQDNAARRGDRVTKGEKPDRGSRQEAQAIRDKLAEKAKRNQRPSGPATTIGGMGLGPKPPPAGSRPVPRVHPKWEERRFTVDAVDRAKALAQPGLAKALAHIGRSGSQLVVTYRYAAEDEAQVSLVMVNVTEANQGSIEGTVVRKNSGGGDIPVQEGDSLTVAQADVVDWTLQVGEEAYGQFLRQTILSALIEAGPDEDGELAAKLAELQADLPE